MRHSKAKKGDALFLEILEAKAGNISEACRAAGWSRAKYYRRLNASQKFAQSVDDIHESLIDLTESALTRKIMDEDLGAICFFLKCKAKHRGWVEGGRPIQKPGKIVVEQLEKLISGDADPLEAAYRIEMAGHELPETLKAQIRKIEPVEDDPASGMTFAEFDEFLEARYLEGKAKAEGQKDNFVPQRQKKVAEIKEELADQDSFKPQNSGENLDG